MDKPENFLGRPFNRLMVAGGIDLIGVGALILGIASSKGSTLAVGLATAIVTTGIGAVLAWPCYAHNCQERPLL